MSQLRVVVPLTMIIRLALIAILRRITFLYTPILCAYLSYACQRRPQLSSSAYAFPKMPHTGAACVLDQIVFWFPALSFFFISGSGHPCWSPKNPIHWYGTKCLRNLAGMNGESFCIHFAASMFGSLIFIVSFKRGQRRQILKCPPCV